MDVICGNKNQYTFTWKIENLNFYEIFNLFVEKVVLSPVFKAENLEQTSWYLAIYGKSDCEDRTRKLSCYLVRHFESEMDEIRIRCQLKVTSGNKCVSINMEEGPMVYRFRKNKFSHFLCEITFPKDSLESEFIIIHCQMAGIFCVDKPISQSSGVRTEANIFKWCPKSLSETKLLSVKRNIEYEVFFTIEGSFADDKLVSITIRKSDCSSSIKCYTQCTISVNCRESLHNYKETRERLLYPFSGNDIFHFDLSLMQKSYDKWRSFKNVIDIVGVILTSTMIDEQSSTGGRKPSEIISVDGLDTTDILRRDQLRMFENRMHADVKLQIGSDSFPAHKDVLASRSPVFSAMFRGETVENQSGIVKITDMDANTLNSLLKYMYATVIDNLNYENALKLLVAADKYQIPSLKEVCSNYLKDSLTDENVCEVLSVADMLSYLELKTSVMEYMKEHASEVLTSDGWKQLLETNANVAGEMLSVISKNIKVALNKD